jgi:hypothetical protein
LLALDTFVSVVAELYSIRLMAAVLPGNNVLSFSDMLSWRPAVVDVTEGELDVRETVVRLPALVEK